MNKFFIYKSFFIFFIGYSFGSSKSIKIVNFFGDVYKNKKIAAASVGTLYYFIDSFFSGKSYNKKYNSESSQKNYIPLKLRFKALKCLEWKKGKGIFDFISVIILPCKFYLKLIK